MSFTPHTTLHFSFVGAWGGPSLPPEPHRAGCQPVAITPYKSRLSAQKKNTNCSGHLPCMLSGPFSCLWGEPVFPQSASSACISHARLRPAFVERQMESQPREARAEMGAPQGWPWCSHPSSRWLPLHPELCQTHNVLRPSTADNDHVSLQSLFSW